VQQNGPERAHFTVDVVNHLGTPRSRPMTF
jgi:hypothetical protein